MRNHRSLIPQIRSLRILIADDHARVRQGVRAILFSNPEWNVCGEAENGREAVEKVRKLKPDLIILDISMPILNGIDAARQIREISPEIKIIILTMHDSAQIDFAARQAGADTVVQKQMATSVLATAIVSLFEMSTPVENEGTPDLATGPP